MSADKDTQPKTGESKKSGAIEITVSPATAQENDTLEKKDREDVPPEAPSEETPAATASSSAKKRAQIIRRDMPGSESPKTRARASSIADPSGASSKQEERKLEKRSSMRRRLSQESLQPRKSEPESASLADSGSKKKYNLFSMMGHIFARSQRGPSDDVEEKSARLEDKEKKPAKLKASQKGQKGHRKTSDLDGERKRDGKHAGPKESSEGRSDDLEHRKAKNGADAAVPINPKTGQPKRYFRDLKTITDFPEDVLARIKDSGIPNDYFDQHLQDFAYCLRFITRDSFRLASKPELDPPDTRPQCSDELLQLAAQSIKTPPKDIKKMYKSLTPAGKGGYGEVFEAKDLETKDHVAIKKVVHVSKKDVSHNLSEVAFLVACKHPNIVTFRAAWHIEDAKEVWIVTEFLEGGTLGTASMAHSFSENHIAFVAHEILQALKYLHARNFAHRDLKSANVMLSIKAEVKLIDFGLCVDLGPGGNRTQLLGSPFWIPPEMIKHVPHDTKADIWSFAVCIIELYYGKVPYGHSRLDCMFRAVTGRLPEILSKCPRLSSTGRDFLLKALVVDPSKRASATDLLAHPFLKNGAKNRDGIENILRTVFVNRTLAAAGI